MKINIKIFLIGLILVSFCLPLYSVYAADTAKPLEITYPPIPEITTPPTTTATTIPDYIKYIFNFLIWVSGFIALGVMVYGGFRYLSSFGNPQAISDAKNQIFAALSGLIILLSSWLILSNINPQLLNINIGTPPPGQTNTGQYLPPGNAAIAPGIYLCTKDEASLTTSIPGVWKYINQINDPNTPEQQRNTLNKETRKAMTEIYKYCTLAASGDLTSDWAAKIIRAYTVPYKSSDGVLSLYGAILYQYHGQTGPAQIIYVPPGAPGCVTDYPGLGCFDVGNDIYSLKAFSFKDPSAGSYVEIYEMTGKAKTDDQGVAKQYLKISPTSSTYFKSGNPVSYFIDISSFPQIGSLEMQGDFIVIFFKDQLGCQDCPVWDYDTDIDVFTSTDLNLGDNIMGTSWCAKYLYAYSYYPCAKTMVIVSGG